MSRKFLNPLNLVNLATDPASASEGDLYWNSSTNKLRIYFDGAWADASDSLQYTYSSTAPSSPSAGDMWVDSSDGTEYTYISDGDSSQWVELGVSGIISGGSNSGGVTSIVAGTNITISPTNGLGNVTINSSGGGGSTDSDQNILANRVFG
jgi:hypothetical protein